MRNQENEIADSGTARHLHARPHNMVSLKRWLARAGRVAIALMGCVDGGQSRKAEFVMATRAGVGGVSYAKPGE